MRLIVKWELIAKMFIAILNQAVPANPRLAPTKILLPDGVHVPAPGTALATAGGEVIVPVTPRATKLVFARVIQPYIK